MSKQPIDPDYYAKRRIEPIDVIEAWHLTFNLGNVIKYIARHGHKGSRRSDLIKAANYCFREATGTWLPKEIVDALVKEVSSRAEGNTSRSKEGV